MRKDRRAIKVAFVGAVIALAFAVSGAFTESNTVPGATLGEGAATVSGYTISSVSYNLNASNPSNVDSVTFTTSTLANTVKIKLVSGGSTWYTCATTNGPANTNWSCNTTSPQVTAASVNELRVVASQ